MPYKISRSGGRKRTAHTTSAAFGPGSSSFIGEPPLLGTRRRTLYPVQSGSVQHLAAIRPGTPACASERHSKPLLVCRWPHLIAAPFWPFGQTLPENRGGSYSSIHCRPSRTLCSCCSCSRGDTWSAVQSPRLEQCDGSRPW